MCKIWPLRGSGLNSSLCTCAVQNGQQTAQNDWRNVWLPEVAMQSQLPHFLVYSAFLHSAKWQSSRAYITVCRLTVVYQQVQTSTCISLDCSSVEWQWTVKIVDRPGVFCCRCVRFTHIQVVVVAASNDAAIIFIVDWPKFITLFDLRVAIVVLMFTIWRTLTLTSSRSLIEWSNIGRYR